MKTSLHNKVNQWRLFPRMFAIFYMVFMWNSAIWFQDLPEPNNAQSGYIIAVISAGAAFFKFYVESGPKQKQVKEDEDDPHD